MVAIINSAVSVGMQPYPLQVEVDIASGLPMTTMVGLADKAVVESKERIRTALKSSGFDYPLGRITINLAPADRAKTGSSLDLPIALAILVHERHVTKPNSTDVFVGELGLTGETRAIPGLLNILLWAEQNDIKRLFIPASNTLEIVQTKVSVYPTESLSQLVRFPKGEIEISPLTPPSLEELSEHKPKDYTDFTFVKGQEVAKRALLIAAAGGHNIMMIGDPGTGKTLMARALQGLLPPLESREILEVNSVYSAAGLLQNHTLVRTRPFRAPHHTASHVSIVGGGSAIRPGEVTLAHRGILFLDEFAEFKRETLEALRQPMEDGVVRISRASGSATYPAKSMIVAAANPTPHGTKKNEAGIQHNDAKSKRYKDKFSGPIMDRFDLVIYLAKEDPDKAVSTVSTEELYTQVNQARAQQKARFADHPLECNSDMTAEHIDTWCRLAEDCKQLLDKAIRAFQLSMRAVHRITKVARTIADIDNSTDIQAHHIKEALQYRNNGVFK